MALGTSDSGITAPMNINSVISKLVGMTPQQRQQFASMHSDDPMMLSAAKYVDNQIKDQARSMMSQQTGAPPPVNQQVVQQMAPPQPQGQAQGLPEESGIGALPAENIRGMAGGGIVAFADRGLVYDPYAYGYQEPGADAKAALRARADAQRFTSNNPVDQMQVLAAKQAAGVPLSSVEQAQLQATRNKPSSVFIPGPAAGSFANAEPVPTDSKVAPGAVAPGAGGARAPAGPGAGGARAPAGAGPMSTGDLQKLYAGFLPKDVQDPYAAQGAEMEKRTQEASERELATAQAKKEGLAGLLAPREERIKGREDRLKKTDDENLNMSLINAGLAMMQSRGQGLAGIAEGAGVGVKQYTEGKKMSEAARQKIEDARDAFDELKFNQTNMSDKEIDAAKRLIAEGANAAQKASIARIETEKGIRHGDAKAVFEAVVKQSEGAMDRQSRLEAARIGASAPSSQMQLALSMGKGDVEAGMRKITEIAAGKFSIQQAYADHLKSAGPGMGMTPQDFAAAMKAFAPPQVVDVGNKPMLSRPSGP
jgi:hypothetical protein